MKCYRSDTDVVWMLRALNISIAFASNMFCLYFGQMPIFFYHLIRVPVPKSSWLISVIPTTLVFISFNLIIFVEISKVVIDRSLLMRVRILFLQ